MTNILCARSRVVPTKRMLTIPKKELAACLVAAELGSSCMKNCILRKLECVSFVTQRSVCFS